MNKKSFKTIGLEDLPNLSPEEYHNMNYYHAIGQLVVNWANCESTLLSAFMLLTKRKREIADILWQSHRASNARIDLLWSLAREQIENQSLKDRFEEMLDHFKGLSRVRNKYCHATYVYGDKNELVELQSTYYSPQAKDPVQKDDRPLDLEALNEINSTIRLLTKLNNSQWDIIFDLEEETGKPLLGMPKHLVEKRQQRADHRRQNKKP